MENTINSLSRKQLIGIAAIVLIMISIAASVYLVQRQQTLKSKAAAGDPGYFVEAFEMRDANGNLIACDSSTNPPVCTTNTLDISVRVQNTTPLLP